MSYWDTSGLAKLYVEEPDTARFRALAQTLGDVATGALSAFELRAVFVRREAEGSLPPGKAAALTDEWKADLAAGTLRLLQPKLADLEREFDAVLAACFSRRPLVFIRTSDALHLAIARAAGETQFVTADARQAEAARLLGLAVLP